MQRRHGYRPMTHSQDMLDTARHGARRFPDQARPAQRFVAACALPDGGFRGRGLASDLYYTVFGLDCWLALELPVRRPPLPAYLATFGDGHGLDFMHWISLARCWARLRQTHDPRPSGDAPWTQAPLDRLAPFACADGGYNTVAGASCSSVTANFLVYTALQDWNPALPQPAGLLRSTEGLRSADGAFGNQPNMKTGTTLATAGALTLQHWLGQPPDLRAAQWLLDQFQNDGGFLSTPGAPVPDLLSTATAIYALHTAGLDLDELADECRDFVISLQRPDGGFGGHRADETSDCEYTYYALLTLGCLNDAT